MKTINKILDFASGHYIALQGTLVFFILLWKLENHLNGGS